MADDVTARFEKAVQHKQVGEYDAALALLKGIITEVPNHASAYNEMGLIYSFSVAIDESVDALNKAVTLVPNNLKFLLDLGKTHTMYGDYDKAIPVFERVLQIDPFNDEAIKNLQFIR